MKTPVIALGLFMTTAGLSSAQMVFPDGISVSNDYVRHMGLIDISGWGADYTGAVRHLGVSFGQLIGIDPTTGQAIVDPRNLLPFKAQSMQVVSNLAVGGTIAGDGSGLTNLNAAANHLATGAPLYVRLTMRLPSFFVTSIWYVSALFSA